MTDRSEGYLVPMMGLHGLGTGKESSISDYWLEVTVLLFDHLRGP
jgi:hypothetical protein